MATQLRRYEIESGKLDEFVAWFPNVVACRAEFGLTLEFAYADHENSQFIWATSHPDDFEATVATYQDSPERAAVFKDFVSPVTKMHVSMVDDVT